MRTDVRWYSLLNLSHCSGLTTFLENVATLFKLCCLVLRSLYVFSCLLKDNLYNYSDGPIGENAAQLLKISWMTVPIGVFFTFAGCFFVFWFQKLSFSDPYAQAILIHGNLYLHAYCCSI